MICQKRELDLTIEEGMKEFIKVVKRPKTPNGDARTLAFIMKNQYQDLLTHIFIPPAHAKTKEMTLKDNKIKKVMLGRPTVDITKIMITIGM